LGSSAPATGVVRWGVNDNNFGVSGQPPSLSFFHLPNYNAAYAWAVVNQYDCLIRVFLPGVPPDPQVGDAAWVGLIGGAVQHNNFQSNFPWEIVFDNAPPNHWSIFREQILDVSNRQAGGMATVGFQYLAINDPHVNVINGARLNFNVVNGAIPNCAPQ
jgi:hypothetical protein